MFYHKGAKAQKGVVYNERTMKQTPKQKSEIEAEARRRTQQILDDPDAMRGIYESLEEVKRGERGVPGKELKRKYKRA